MRDKTFVYVRDYSQDIRINLRYATTDNFMGRVIDGYNSNDLTNAVLTKEATDALICAQEKFSELGYDIVLYDVFRPQRAVDSFKLYLDEPMNQDLKDMYLPRIDEDKIIAGGYIAEKSGHSRGSTVDLTIIKHNDSLGPIIIEERVLTDGFSFKYLNDGTVDMGTAFDFLDESSHVDTDLLADPLVLNNRQLLSRVMNECGFEGFYKEWWHFTLRDEPFLDTYFDFPLDKIIA